MAISEQDFCGGVHATAASLFGIMGAWNVLRWCVTKRRRNLGNALLYGSLWGFEIYQTRCHWSSLGSR